MRRKFGWSSTGAIAPLTALLAALIVNAAEAGDAAPDQSPENGSGTSSCGSGGEACARISGYIKARSDFSPGDLDGLRPGRFAPMPPLRVGAGAAGQATANAANRDMFLLDVGHDERVR